MASAALFIALVILAWLVWSGLRRNHGRHEELRTYRETVMRALDLPDEPPRKEPLWHGRRLYFALFVTAWVLGGYDAPDPRHHRHLTTGSAFRRAA